MDINNVAGIFCDFKCRLFNNIINMKFKCTTDKACDKAFSMFPFSLQYSYYYPIFYFLYFCIYVFDDFLIKFDHF